MKKTHYLLILYCFLFSVTSIAQRATLQGIVVNYSEVRFDGSITTSGYTPAIGSEVYLFGSQSVVYQGIVNCWSVEAVQNEELYIQTGIVYDSLYAIHEAKIRFKPLPGAVEYRLLKEKFSEIKKERNAFLQNRKSCIKTVLFDYIPEPDWLGSNTKQFVISESSDDFELRFVDKDGGVTFENIPYGEYGLLIISLKERSWEYFPIEINEPVVRFRFRN